ncbi:hypothetical protein Q7P37_004313 [Cladosporium fusiforme]
MVVTRTFFVALAGWCGLASASTDDTPSLTEAAATKFLSEGKTCCAALKLALPKKVSYTDSESYNESLSSYWSLQEGSLQPACIVSPTDSRDVAVAVTLLNLGGSALPGECDFAVRSGGHTPSSGAANIERGVTIDLRKLNQVTPSEDLSTVTVGPGNNWGRVYSKLDELGIAIGGGRVSTVGVGGLTLGGGISFFSPRKGFVCDDVVRFEIVLPSGLIVNATEKSYPDLWKALKGGSNNFGIVTAFESKAFEQGKFWGGFVGHDISTRESQFAAFEAFAGSAEYDPYAAFINNYIFTAAENSWYIVNSLEYTKAEEDPAVFENITSLPQTFSTMRISNLTDFAVELGGPNPMGLRHLFITATYANSAKLMSNIFDISNSTVQDLLDVTDLSYNLSFQPMPTAITSKAKSRGGNSLGLSDADGNLFNLLLTVSWGSKSDDDRVYRQSKALFDEAESVAKELGLYNEYVYLNYAAPWQDPIGGYGAESKAHLKAVSKKYDPEGMFQTQVPGGFKVFDE